MNDFVLDRDEESVLEFAGVEKRFDKTNALSGLTFSVPRGSVVGFVGRNGAGKSTAIRCLVGLQKPTCGQVRLFGQDPWNLPVADRQRVGYLSETEVPFQWATTRELIRFCKPLYPNWDEAIEENVIKRFRVDVTKKLRAMSLGQRRAVGLLLAICPRPEVLILDEPAANLDAVLRREFLDQVLELVADADRTVFFSSHLLTDVERVADRLALIHDGEILLYQELDSLKENVRRLRMVFPDSAPSEVKVPRALRVRRHGREVLATVVGYSDETVRQLEKDTGATIETHSLGLEEMFIDLVGDDSPVLAA